MKLQGLSNVVQRLKKRVAWCSSREAGIPMRWMCSVEAVLCSVEDDGHPLHHHCPRDGIPHPRHVALAVQPYALHVVVVDEVPQQVQVMHSTGIVLKRNKQEAWTAEYSRFSCNRRQPSACMRRGGRKGMLQGTSRRGVQVTTRTSDLPGKANQLAMPERIDSDEPCTARFKRR